MRNTFLKALLECARQDERIWLITADLGYSVVEKFTEEFPNRFLNVGIQEQNAVSLAAGLALSGKIPYVYSIIPFATMRCFEQIRVDVAYLNTNVRLVGVGAGLGYGPAGATHHAIEDIAIMRALPNMTVLCPGDPHETLELTRASVRYSGPIYLRLGKGGEALLHPPGRKVAIGKAIQIRSGRDLTLLTTSNMLETGISLASALESSGLNPALVHFPTVKPIDREALLSIAAQGKPLFSIEEHNTIGGFGSAIAEIITELDQSVRLKRFGVPDQYTHSVGSQKYLRQHFALTPDSLKSLILKDLAR